MIFSVFSVLQVALAGSILEGMYSDLSTYFISIAMTTNEDFLFKSAYCVLKVEKIYYKISRICIIEIENCCNTFAT